METTKKAPVKVGVMGLGWMCRGMTETLKQLPEGTLWACASRSLEKALAFGQEFGFQRAYGSYEALYNDPEVELVYIATTHDRHYEQVKSCLLHGKHVFCEKAFTVHLWEAEELVALARERNLFLMEAQMLRFMPLVQTLRELVAGGAIGELVSFTANYIWPLEHKQRVIRPELGGGGLLDIGVYPLTLVDLLLGHDFVKITSDALLTDTGVDCLDHIILRTAAGVTASLTVATRGTPYKDGVINGTQGYLILRDVNRLRRVEQYDREGKLLAAWDKPPQISDYVHELTAALRAVQEGKTQCPEYPWDALLRQQKLLEDLRKGWGVTGA